MTTDTDTESDGEWVDEPTVYKLTFPHRPGLVMRLRSVDLGAFLDLTDLAEAAMPKPGEAPRPEDMAEIRKLFDRFADGLVSWNVVEKVDGRKKKVPATREGVMSRDPVLILEAISAWLTAMGDVPAPLGATSSGGDRSLELSLPMEPSESPDS